MPGWCWHLRGAPFSKETMDARSRRRADQEPRLYRSYKARRNGGPSRSRSPIPVRRRLQAVVSVSGFTDHAGAGRIQRLSRSSAVIFTLDGKPADVSKARQNERFAVVLKIIEGQNRNTVTSLVSDYFAGRASRSTNPHLVFLRGHRYAWTWNRGWRGAGEYTNFRDDRFYGRHRFAPAMTIRCSTVAYVGPGGFRRVNTCCRRAYVRGHVQTPPRYGRHRHRGLSEVRPAK